MGGRQALGVCPPVCKSCSIDVTRQTMASSPAEVVVNRDARIAQIRAVVQERLARQAAVRGKPVPPPRYDEVRGVNYFCRVATTISAGEGLAKVRWRPQRHSVIVGDRSLAVNEICLAFLSLIPEDEDGGGRCGKRSAVFQGAVGASARPRGRQRPRPLRRGDRRARVGAPKPVGPQVVRRGDRRSWGILRGRLCHEAVSDRLAAAFPRRVACSVRKLGTSNSSSTE